MNNKILNAIFFFCILLGSLSSCNQNTVLFSEHCSGMIETDGTAYYFNEIDKALACAKQTEKPVLVQFRLWAASNYTFEEKIIPNKQVQNHLNSKAILLSLTTDDKKKISLMEYSKTLEAMGFENTNSVGTANEQLKNHFIKNKDGNHEPQFILVDQNLKPLSESWGYSSDYKLFLKKFREVMK